MKKSELNMLVKNIMTTVSKKSGLIGYETGKKILRNACEISADEYEYCIRHIVKKLKI